MAITWKGVFPALTTQFTEEGTLDLPLFLHNVDAQLAAGVHGLIIGGSLGEASTLRHEEKMELLVATKARVGGRVPVLVNIAESATESALHVAREAARHGADGLMVLPPLKYRPTPAETIQWFRTIASETDLPVMVYNNPVDYGTEVTLPMFEELLKLPSVQAVKESTRQTAHITHLRRAFGDRLAILCGVDTLALESILLGADGWVAGLVDAFPRETVALYELAIQGRLDEARALYRWFMPLLELDLSPQLVQNIKLAQALTGLGSEHVRPPRRPLEGAERARVIALIEKQLACRPHAL